jgi:hypothetical protein
MPALRIPIPQGKAVSMPVSVQISEAPTAAAPSPVSPPAPPPRDSLPGLLGLLLGGNALFQIARLALGAGKLRRMRRVSVPFPLPSGLERRLRENGPLPPVEISAAASTAMLVGAWRPVIILPSKAGAWPEDRLEIVLRHELAHLRRGDHLSQPLLALLRLTYGWQPLLWLALDRLRREREKACDDRVLAEATAPSAYAQALVDAAADLRHGVPGLAMASTSRIEERLRAILDPAVPRRRAGRGFAMLAIMLALAVAGASSLRIEAQEAPAKVAPAGPQEAGDASSPKFRITIHLKDSGPLVIPALYEDGKSWEPMLPPNPKKELSFSAVVASGGRVDFDTGNTMRTPKDWQPAQRVNALAAIPMLPTEFEKWNIGWAIAAEPKLVDDLIHLHLNFVFTEFQGWQRAQGEGTGPIYADVRDPVTGHVASKLLIDNKGRTPFFSKAETPTVILAKPGVDYEVKAHFRDGWATAVVRCDRIDAPSEVIEWKATTVSIPTPLYRSKASEIDEALDKGEIESLVNLPGVEVVSLPSVTFRSGERARVAIEETSADRFAKALPGERPGTVLDLFAQAKDDPREVEASGDVRVARLDGARGWVYDEHFRETFREGELRGFWVKQESGGTEAPRHIALFAKALIITPAPPSTP